MFETGVACTKHIKIMRIDKIFECVGLVCMYSVEVYVTATCACEYQHKNVSLILKTYTFE